MSAVARAIDRNGYQMRLTEVGPLPQDWQVAPLRQLSTFENGDRGFNYPSKRDFVSGGRPFVNAGHFKDGRISLLEMDYITDQKFDALGAGKYRAGDILYCLRGSLGKFAIVDENLALGAIASSVVIVRPKRTAVSTEWLAVYFSSEVARRMVALWAGGAAQPNLGARDLARFLVPVPPTMREQDAIVEALSDASSHIEALDALIGKRRAIKRGVMDQLLTGQRRLPGFKGDWARKSFEEVFEFLPTATNSRADLGEGGDAGYVHYGDIHTLYNDQLDVRRIPLPRIDRRLCTAAAALKNGDWIMADASEDYDGVAKSVEVMGLRDGELAFSGLHTFLLREKQPTFAPGFKAYLGSAPELRKQYLRVMTGMKVFGVSKAALRDLLVPVPEQDEQLAITAVLDDLSAEIGALEDRRSKAALVRQGMMQELLTGRVRLV